MVGFKVGFIKPGDKVLLSLTGSGLKLVDELINYEIKNIKR